MAELLKNVSQMLHELGLILHAAMRAQNKEGVKGRYWFMDADVRDGALTGKTGKTILTILRHLGRLHEVLLRGIV